MTKSSFSFKTSFVFFVASIGLIGGSLLSLLEQNEIINVIKTILFSFGISSWILFGGLLLYELISERKLRVTKDGKW